jgi:hypothetical protein
VDRQRLQEATGTKTNGRGRVQAFIGADLAERSAEAMRALSALPLLLLLGSCGIQGQSTQDSACLNGGSSCAAADAPAGMRQVLKGHRMVKAQWIEKTNKESGALDIGIRAQWAPITERR